MIGDILRKLRTERGLTLKQMGDIFHVSHMTYQRYEKEDCDVSTDMLVKFADFYGVSTDYLLGREKVTLTENDRLLEEILIDIFRNLPDEHKKVLFNSVREAVNREEKVTADSKSILIEYFKNKEKGIARSQKKQYLEIPTPEQESKAENADDL